MVGILVFGASFVVAQDDVQTPDKVRRKPTIEQIRNRDFDRRRREMARVSNLPRESSKRRMKGLSKEDRRRFKEATNPSREDLLRYKEFLKQSNTGIFRLLPDYECETENIVKVDGECAGFVPGAWSYSFRRDNYSDKYLHDVGLRRDVFFSRSLLNQGIFVSLGDIPVEKVDLNSVALKFVVGFEPGATKDQAASQFKDLEAGLKRGGFVYSNMIRLAPDTTYVLRVIAYRFSERRMARNWEANDDRFSDPETRVRDLKLDKRNDSVIAFRVIRKSDDGGVTIIWKRLAKSKSPKLIFKEGEKLADFGNM
jgi:hypothetical protein